MKLVHRTIAVVLSCDELSEADELLELANKLASLVEHTPFDSSVDEKYADSEEWDENEG